MNLPKKTETSRKLVEHGVGPRDYIMILSQMINTKDLHTIL